MKATPIPYGRQHITEDDIQAVVDALKSDFLTQGPRIPEFEASFANYVKAPHALAVANGTAALHLSVLALGLNPGEKVLTTPITFAASANCVRYAGGEVEFVDIDPDTFLMDLNQLEDKLKRNRYKGIIPVDFTGLPVDMEALRELADKHGCWVLEDACHAPGGSFENSAGEKVMAGSSRYADAAIFSFHPVKHIAAGEGGMITTSSKAIADRVAMLRTHGITKEPALLHENHGGWYYEMQDLGYNYRLTDMQAALAQSQLKRANEGLHRRREIAARYDKAFADLPGIQVQAAGATEKLEHHAYHLYIIRVDDRKGLYDYLRSKGIFAQVHYIPVHTLPYYQERYGRQSFPHSESFYDRCLSIPMYPSMTDEDQERVINAVSQFLNG